MTEKDVSPINSELFSEAYDELRHLAHRINGQNGSLTWNPTAMVNEAYLRLARSKSFHPTSALHLKHTIIRAMKYILVEAARRKTADRRGGGAVPLQIVPLDDSIAHAGAFDPGEILTVNVALDELARHSDFQARVFEYQFFGGLEISEIAEMLGVSDKKVQRSLRLAKAFLSIALKRGGTE